MQNQVVVFAAVITALAAPSAIGQIYKCKSSAGKVEYQQAPCSNSAKGSVTDIDTSPSGRDQFRQGQDVAAAERASLDRLQKENGTGAYAPRQSSAVDTSHMSFGQLANHVLHLRTEAALAHRAAVRRALELGLPPPVPSPQPETGPRKSDGTPNYRYTGASGTKYQYDMGNPSDRIQYGIDPAAQLRDRISVNPGRNTDRGIGQRGAGAER